MEERLIMKKLLDFDNRLHSLIWELQRNRRESLSLSELNKIMEDDRISDEDSSKLIREMRDKEYGL